MKKFFIVLFPAFAAFLLNGCGESGESTSANPVKYDIPLVTAETGTPETTTLTTCSTLRTFAEMTTMQHITFAEMTRMKAFGITGNDDITPWGIEKDTAAEKTNITEETTIKETVVKETQTEEPDIEETNTNEE